MDIVMHKCKFIQIVMNIYVELTFRVPIILFEQEEDESKMDNSDNDNDIDNNNDGEEEDVEDQSDSGDNYERVIFGSTGNI